MLLASKTKLMNRTKWSKLGETTAATIREAVQYVRFDILNPYWRENHRRHSFVPTLDKQVWQNDQQLVYPFRPCVHESFLISTYVLPVEKLER